MSQSSTTHYRYSLAAVFGVLFLFLFPATVAAIPITDYHSNIKDAISTLGHLSQSGENFDSELPNAVESVRAKLPKHEPVEFEGEVYNVDNSWLHKELDELEKADNRSERLAHIVWSLQAIEARVAERANPGGSPAENKEWARTRLESILARPEYATDTEGSNALIRVIQDFLRWLEKFLPKPRVGNGRGVNWITLIAQILVIGLAVAMVGTATWSRLVAANTRYLPSVPWAAAIMAPILVAFWLYFARGRGWPAGTAAARRLGGRANRVPDHLWGPALGAGVLGLIATLLLQGVLARMIVLPQQQDLDPSSIRASRFSHGW
jgi:hypothetical protein